MATVDKTEFPDHIQAYIAGMTISEITKTYGLDSAKLYREIRALDIPLRSQVRRAERKAKAAQVECLAQEQEVPDRAEPRVLHVVNPAPLEQRIIWSVAALLLFGACMALALAFDETATATLAVVTGFSFLFTIWRLA